MHGMVWLAAIAAGVAAVLTVPARAAECPNTCVAFAARTDVEHFLDLLAQPDAKPAGAYLKDEIAHGKAEMVPVGTQFILLAAHQATARQWAFYAIQLPGAPVTKYLVAIR